MKLKTRGKSTSEIEILNISPDMLWIYVQGKEYGLSQKEYPWFRNAKISEISNVKLLHGHHLYWPDLDVDLDVESLQYPDRFPLISK